MSFALLGDDLLLLVLQQLDIVELPVAAAVCSAWSQLVPGLLDALDVLCCGCVLDGDGDECEEHAEALFREPARMTHVQRAISAARMGCFRRRHPALARRLGRPLSVDAFLFDGPMLCVAVVCGRGFIVLDRRSDATCRACRPSRGHIRTSRNRPRTLKWAHTAARRARYVSLSFPRLRPLSADRLIARGRSLACRRDICLLPRLVGTQNPLRTRPPAFYIAVRRPLHDLLRSRFSQKCTHTHMRLAPPAHSAGMKGMLPATIRGASSRLRTPDDNSAAWDRPRRSKPGPYWMRSPWLTRASTTS